MKKLESSIPDFMEGLTAEEVEKRREEGLVNCTPENITKTNAQIIKDNVCTLFNLFNFIIAICLALVGAYSNMFFIIIILMNISIGVGQEIHAKKLVENLSLLSAAKATVVRDGVEEEIATNEVVLDDIIIFAAGEQIITDSIIINGEVEVNESLLTGESDVIRKKAGDSLLSGSFVVSGRCYGKTEHVGNDNYSVNIAQQAKKHKKVNSQLMGAIRKVTKFTGLLIVPLGAILFVQAFFMRGDVMRQSVIVTAAALLGMLPKGLVLLINIALASGVIKLSKKRVLVQEMFALESLSHVDLLCLDKTGTITQGKMSVQSVIRMEKVVLPCEFEELMSSFLIQSEDNNATFSAMKDYFPKEQLLKAKVKIPFSSDRKWSAMSFEGGGSLVLGAPERIMQEKLPKELLEYQQSGARVILAGYTTEAITEETLPQLIPIAGICITDPLRANTKETLALFQKEGIKPVIISGDSPITVSAIAKQAGLSDGHRFIDMSTVETKEELVLASKEYTVFGRVSPLQKKQFVKAFQQQGHTVAMTGDGVNDILALREADCSIAMGEGSDAARQVSQLVLLDSDFSVLPSVLGEGRRAVNNVTRVAGIFFVKTIYSILLTIICIIGNMPFMFVPIQITLIDLAIEGYPAFFLSFEPDNRKIKKHFLPTVFARAIPNALSIVVTVMGIQLFAKALAISPSHTATLMYYVVAFMGIAAVWKACVPFNKLRLLLCITMTVGFYVATILFHSLLHVSLLSGKEIIIFLCAAAISWMLERVFKLGTNYFFKRRYA